MNANEAINAVNTRKAHLTNLMQQKGCGMPTSAPLPVQSQAAQPVQQPVYVQPGQPVYVQPQPQVQPIAR